MSYSSRNSKKELWTTIALFNLCIVALLGFTLRSKILFPLRVFDFSNILHAHSHYAFAGWITMALMALMVYEILPEEMHNKKSYGIFMTGTLISAAGMLVFFLYQGYAFFSILFSTQIGRAHV